MKLLPLLLLFSTILYAGDYTVYGPQGGLSMTVTLPGATFDPQDPPTFVRCFGMMKVGREYLLSTQQLDIYGTAASYHGPVRIIHGSDDTLVPMWCSEDFLKTYGDAARLMVVENENHRISRRTRYVAKLVTDFFSSF